MPFMAILVFVFLASIATATFLESPYGYNDIMVSRYFVYGAKWFEWVLFLLSINLINNIFKYHLLQIKKIGSLLFHISFLVILIGSYVTRYYSYEGIMKIREGSTSNTLLTTQSYLQFKVEDKVNQYVDNIPFSISGPLSEAKADFHGALSNIGLGWLTSNQLSLEDDFDFPDTNNIVHHIEIEYYNFMPGYFESDTIKQVENGDTFLHIVTVGDEGRQNNYLGHGKVLDEKGILIAVNEQTDAAVNIVMTDSGEFVQSPFDIQYLQMRDQSSGVIPRDSLVPFLPMRLYIIDGVQFVYKQKLKNVELEKISEINHKEGVDVLQVKIKDGNFEEIIDISSQMGASPRFATNLNGLNYHFSFGAKLIEIPFIVQLHDFEQARYPGTDNPSSYASEVRLIDTANKVEFDHRIFMNNVLDYGGYRFFQSSFDPDEKGTVLSVNHDKLGTNLTYFGYALMALGMLISIFASGSRFKMLFGKAEALRKKREALMVILPLFLGLSFGGYAQQSEEQKYDPVDVVHAESFGRLIIQDFQGRFAPVHTLADKILRKVSRQQTYNGLTALQVFIGLHTDFGHWFEEPIVYVSGDSTRRLLGVEGKRASMKEFYDDNGEYKLSTLAKAALRKSPRSRNVYEKDVIKTDERFSILRGVVMGYYLRIYPMKDDPTDTWYAPADNLDKLHGNDSIFVNGITQLYIFEVQNSQETGEWAGADSVLTLIQTYQKGAGNKSLLLSTTEIEWEIFYNKANIFKWLNYSYLIVGLTLLIFQFINLFKPNFKVNKINKIGVVLFVGMAGLHVFGLGLRWYLSGHAPWSNGYEAIVFISFITIVAGLIFVRNSKIIIGAAGILAWLMLFVAHLNNMDPEITQLVPVLKSYWLMIHVAIITGSYGFLGLPAILAIVSLMIDIFKTKESKKRMLLTAKELRLVSEMSMTIGIFMLAIGTFLGGVWANESWGRYWGWDSKETWALASVLTYTIILHFRFIPKLKSDYVFNLGAMWGYGSIIMTFYGVNFYLTGLHSYATGDPLPIPIWVPITLLAFLTLSIAAYYRKGRTL